MSDILERVLEQRCFVRWAVAVAACYLALLATAAPANAHPVLLFTDPVLDGALTAPPEMVTLVFNEPVTVGRRAIMVTDLQEQVVAAAGARTAKEGTVVTGRLDRTLRPGAYRVRWEVVGADG